MKLKKYISPFLISLSLICLKIVANPIPSGSALTLVGPTTISLPGTYRLGNDINGTVTINASNVEFNLDNHKISTIGTGIQIDSGNSDIIVKNGIIEGDTLFPGVMTMSFTTTAVENIQFPNAIGHGVFIDTCTHITIADIDFILNDCPILAETSTCIIVNNCTFRNFGVTGIIFDAVNQTLIQNCKFFNTEGASTIGIFAQFGENHIIRNNSINNTAGIGIDTINTNNCLIEENSLNENLIGIAFLLSSSSIIARNTGVQNLAGILATGNRSIFKENIMNNNGFGILTLNSFSNCFINNVTNINTTNGINSSNSDDSYFLNKSQQNGSSGTANYIGIISSDIIITYALGLGDFTTTNTRPFLNLSVIP